MRFLTGMLLLSVSLTSLVGEPITKGEREFAQSALQASRKMFLDSVDGVSEAQWNFKPGPDRWSISEVAEHIVLSEGLIFQAVQGALQSPAREKMTDAQAMDEKIMAGVPDRTNKFKAPEQLIPHGQYKTSAEAAQAFKAARDPHIQYAGETQDALREHFLKHPVLGDMDAYQWILLMSAHTERHVNQILEVKASAGYPKQ